jgi:cytochrome P450
VALFWASANRDEEVFADPFAFQVDRSPNPHFAFGVGEHFCMGAHVARVELETIFRHLIARLEWFEVSGPVERLGSRSTEASNICRCATAWRSAAAKFFA